MKAASGSSIETFTGRTFDPLDPKFADVNVEDIAHALSNQCRFSGHTRHFYSVAEHSVRVSLWLRDEALESHEVQLWGLLHDGSEAYLVDLPRPLKATKEIGFGYRAVEVNVQRAVCQRFGLCLSQPDIVTEADEVLLATEVRDLMHPEKPYWGKLRRKPTSEQRIIPWSSEAAKSAFLRRFDFLVNGGVS